MALQLLSKTYWHGTQIRFREPTENIVGEPVALNSKDGARIRGVYWTPKNNPNPKVAVIAAHTRVDFSEHHTFGAILKAGYACLGANVRSLNNDTDCLHEKLVMDIGTYMDWLKERGVEKIIMLGNSGGGALFSFYQSQAKLAPADRIRYTPGGKRTRLEKVDLIPGDAIIYMAAHCGQGLIINEVIDPSVVNEADPFLSDPELDMYDPRNGFKPPPEWIEYTPEFVARYRNAQLDRVRRIDACAHEMINISAAAAAQHGAEDFESLPLNVQRRVLQREAFQPLITIYRTMANLHYVDRTMDPTDRDYGSLLSPRPDLMNYQRLGFARIVTPDGWLSTWSGLSSNASIPKNAGSITEPAVVINAGRDLDVYPKTHSQLIFDTVQSADKEYWDFPNALHYFEPEDGEQDNATLNDLMARLVPWIKERFPL